MVRPSVTPCGVNISVERTINTLPGIFPSVVKKVINYGVALPWPKYFGGGAKSFGKMLEFCHHILRSRVILIRNFT